MECDQQAKDNIISTWRRTNARPDGKKRKDKEITPEMKIKHDKLSDILFDKLYKEDNDPFG